MGRGPGVGRTSMARALALDVVCARGGARPGARPAGGCSSRGRRTPARARRHDELDRARADVARSARRATAAYIRPQRRGRRAGDGDSSTIFWWRRWTEHSRSNRCTTVPCESPNTWISTCASARGSARGTVASPNATAPRALARRRPRPGSRRAVRTTRMPLATAARRRLHQHRITPDAASSPTSSGHRQRHRVHGTGTAARRPRTRSASPRPSSPSRRSTAGSDRPHEPAALTASANVGFSDRNP